MSYKETIFKTLDNTGVRKVKILSIYKAPKAQPGGLVTVVVKEVLPKRKIKKGQICRGVVVRLKRKISRYSGYTLSFNENSVILLKKGENIPLGTKISGCVYYELRLRGYLKIVALSSYLV